MSELGKIKSFIEAVSYEGGQGPGRDWKNGRYPFVTISREAGAGGNSLGNAILDCLQEHHGPLFQGWQRFNQELCRKIAEEPGLNVSLEPLLKFEYRSQVEDMMEEIIAGTTPQDVVNKKIFQLMRSLAGFGKVILVGRGGVCLSRDLPLGVHVRLVAPLEARIKRMGDFLELTYKKAKELVLEQDKSRAKLVKTFFNRNIDDSLLYDVVWNTGTVPMDQIARSIVLMIEKKALAYISEKTSMG